MIKVLFRYEIFSSELLSLRLIFLKDEIVAAKSSEQWFLDRNIYPKNDSSSVFTILFTNI